MMMWEATCTLFFYAMVTAIRAQLKVAIFDATAVTKLPLEILGHRTITLTTNRTYELECLDGSSSGNWVSSNLPNPVERTLVLPMHNKTSQGDYTCMGSTTETKVLTIIAGNPSVITSAKQLYFTRGETIPGDDRDQSILVSGDPEPTVKNISWFLNGTIPLSTMSQFIVQDYALSLPPVIGYEHSGNYTIVVNTSAGSVRDSFVITVGVIPSVTISTPPAGLIVGDSLTLTCTDSQGVPPPSFTWQKCSGSSPADCTTLDGEEDNVNILQMQSSSSMLMVNPVKLSNGGEYKCRAQNSFGLKIIEQQIGVSIPPAQTVSMTASTQTPVAGNDLQLTCATSLPNILGINHDNITAEITWRKGTEVIDTSNSRISVVDVETTGSSRTQRLTISPMSRMLDSGSYTCAVVLRVTGSGTTSTAKTSTATQVNIEAPDVVQVTPSQLSVLDTSPYNEATVNCSVRNFDTMNLVNVSAEYSWYDGIRQLTHGQDGISISNAEDLDDISQLSLVASGARMLTLTCRVKVNAQGIELFQIEQGSTITIKGPTKPASPSTIAAADVRFNEAVIQITVTEISYTPEQYYVQYGIAPDNLNLRSQTVSGSDGVVSTDEVVSITLRQLRHNTQYHYSVVAVNSVGETTSSIFTFQTNALVLLQVRAGPFLGCQGNQVQDAVAVNEFFKNTIISAINQRCFCDFPGSNLINGSAVCPGDGSRDLVYRAYIVRLDHLSSNQLLTYVNAWVKQEPYVQTGVGVIRFNPNCTSMVTSTTVNVCPGLVTGPSEPEPTFGTNEIYILVAIVVGGLLLLLVVIISILACYIFSQSKQIRFLKRKNKATYAVTNARVQRRESSVSGTGDSSSGFADMQGVNWNKGISIINCPAYGTAYTTVKRNGDSCQAVVYDTTNCKDEDPTIAIYDTVHDFPHNPPHKFNNISPRIAVSNCSSDGSNGKEESDDEEDNTLGSVV